MLRLIRSQLRRRGGRAIALLAGILVATTAFTVLTAAARTSQLRVTGAVSAHFVTAYDILVRPTGATSALESATGTVQPNFLSGIAGGITLRQYQQIQKIAGVDVAAPIAMVGYALPAVPITVPVSSISNRRQLFRYSTSWLSAGDSSQASEPASYLYLTPNRLRTNDSGTTTQERTASGGWTPVCNGYSAKARSPFDPAAQSAMWCWSNSTGYLGLGKWQDLSSTKPGLAVFWSFPMLIAAIDPAAEAKLDGLSGALTSGHYLGQNAGSSLETQGQFQQTTFPVLASSEAGVSETAVTTVRRLPSPAEPARLDAADAAAEASAPGPVVQTTRTTAQQAYAQLLGQLTGKINGDFAQGVDGYWNVGATRYRRDGDGSLTPVTVENSPSVWSSVFQYSGFVHTPLDDADTQYRSLAEHESTNLDISDGTEPFPVPRAVGVFDPARIAAFDPLSAVPLSAYDPTRAAPADPASRGALHGANLLPSLNLGGYVSSPPQLLTTLAALPALEDSATFAGDLHAGAPISVIRVRVAGVTGPDAVSRERVKQVAQQIAVRTGLDVDIVIGSSPAPTTIALPAGRFGQPALRVTEGWVRKGVAVAILTASDRKSLVLFVLILIVCGLFVANAATAAVRGRRAELALLAALGWTRPRLFGVVLGELTVIGLAAGVLGGLLSVPVAAAAGLHASPARAALAVPAALLLALLAGAAPAWTAARADPAVAVRPAVLGARRGHHARGICGLAAVNLLRTPGRTAVAGLGLAVGVAALTLVTAVSLGFRGAVVGSLLGDAVAVEIRGVDYVAVAATVLLGVLSVADVLYLNLRERAAEFATFRALGWREGDLRRLVVTEGALLGAIGSVTGAAFGLVGAALFAGQMPVRLYLLAAATLLGGTTVTVLASLLPLRLLARLPTARLLAEE